MALLSGLMDGTRRLTGRQAGTTRVGVTCQLPTSGDHFHPLLFFPRPPPAYATLSVSSTVLAGVPHLTARLLPPCPTACSGQAPSPRLAGAVQHALRERHRVEVPVACAGGRLWCRISCQIYNTPAGGEWGEGGFVALRGARVLLSCGQQAWQAA